MANSPLNDLIQKFGADVVEKAMQNLGVTRTVKGKKRRAVASGTLQKSLAYYYNAKKGSVEFFAKGQASKYADFVEQGVNGRKVSHNSPYSFSKSMVNIEAIKRWMSIKPIKVRDKSGKFIKQTEANIDNAAMNIARAISSRGIAPLFYWRDAIEQMVDVYEPQFAEALGKEIKIVIEDNLQKRIKV